MATVALVTEAEGAHRTPYIDAIRDLGLIERAYLVDPDGTTVEETRSMLGAKLAGSFGSVGEMLQVGRPDMAIVTMVAVNAPPVIRPLLEAGVHVMAEKPACVQPDDFAALAELADRRGVHLMLALANRLAPWAEELRRIVQSGGIGKLYAVHGLFLADQTRIQRQLDEPNWTFQQHQAGGGHLAWLGIHWLDLMRYVTGDEVTEVTASTGVVGGAPIDVEDLALVNLRFGRGGMGMLMSGYLLDQGYHQLLTFYGEEGWARWSDGERSQLEWHSPAPRMNESPDRKIVFGGRGGGYTLWVRETLRACLGEREAPITTADGLTVLRIVHGAYESAATGRLVGL